MTKPASFISSSDYATLKNDGEVTFTIILPASLFITAGTTYSLTDTASVGTTGASERAQIHSSKLNKRYICSLLSVERSGTVGGVPSSYSILASLTRTTGTTLRASVEIFNPYSGALTTASGSELFTFYVRTFIPPLRLDF